MSFTGTIADKKIAFIFPGQGSQKVGMGRVWADASPEARQTFEEADEALGFPLSRRRDTAERLVAHDNGQGGRDCPRDDGRLVPGSTGADGHDLGSQSTCGDLAGGRLQEARLRTLLHERSRANVLRTLEAREVVFLEAGSLDLRHLVQKVSLRGEGGEGLLMGHGVFSACHD